MVFFRTVIPILWDSPISKLRWGILAILSSFAVIGLLLAAGNSTSTAFLLLPSIGGEFANSWRSWVGGLLVGVGIIASLNLFQLLTREDDDH